jgi:hypothetical protein
MEVNDVLSGNTLRTAPRRDNGDYAHAANESHFIFGSKTKGSAKRWRR